MGLLIPFTVQAGIWSNVKCYLNDNWCENLGAVPTLRTEQGGTATDTSAWTGLPYITAGVWGTTSIGISSFTTDNATSDEAVLSYEATGNALSWTTADGSGACSAGAVCTGGHTHVGVNEVYGVGWNSDTATPEKDDIYDYLHLIDTDDDGKVNTLDGAIITPNNIIYGNATSDEQCLTYEETGDTFTWQACGSGGGGGVWSTSTGLLYTSDVVVVGGSATTTAGYAFEVIGNTLMDGLGISGAFNASSDAVIAGSLNLGGSLVCSGQVSGTNIHDTIWDANSTLWNKSGTTMTATDTISILDVNATGTFDHLVSSNEVFTAYLYDNFGNGALDMTGDPWALGGISFQISSTGTLILEGYNGFLKATAGVVGTSSIGVADIADISTNYISSSTGLTYLSTTTAASTYFTIAGANASNTVWLADTGWNGGNTGLVAATGRTSLELGDAALLASTTWTTPSFVSVNYLATGTLGVSVQAYNANTATTGSAITGFSGILDYTHGGTGTSTALANQYLWWGDGTGKLVQVASSTFAGVGGGITSLNGLDGTSQTFATSNDTNIGLDILSEGTSHTFTPIWIGTLANARIASSSEWATYNYGTTNYVSTTTGLTYLTSAIAAVNYVSTTTGLTYLTSALASANYVSTTTGLTYLTSALAAVNYVSTSTLAGYSYATTGATITAFSGTLPFASTTGFTAGRSLTLSSSDVALDSEIYIGSYKWVWGSSTSRTVIFAIEKDITITELGGISDGTQIIDCGITAETSLATSTQIAGLSMDTDGASTTSFVDAGVSARQKIKCVLTVSSGTSSYPYITYTIDD